MTNFRFVLPFLLALILLGALLVSCDYEDDDDSDAENVVDDDSMDADDDTTSPGDDDDDDPWPAGDDPNRYHWDGLADPFYEGWFFRVALPDGRSFAFLYCVQNPGATEDDLGGAHLVAARNGGELFRQSWDTDEFIADADSFEVEIAGHHAAKGRVDGVIQDGGHEVAWSIDYEIIEPWLNTMGDFTNAPNLPINWYVGALRGSGSGVIEWDGEVVEFAEAAVFQDHNWGDFFPGGYAWMQSQEFPDSGDALALAGGKVGAIEAGMFVWRRDGELVELRSQDFNASFDFSSDYDSGLIEADIQTANRRYLISGFFDNDTPSVLPAPMPEGFLPYTRMALSGRIRVQTYTQNGDAWDLVEEIWSDNAGVEMGGDYGPPIER